VTSPPIGAFIIAPGVSWTWGATQIVHSRHRRPSPPHSSNAMQRSSGLPHTAQKVAPPSTALA
jgi:hypothetical protein